MTAFAHPRDIATAADAGLSSAPTLLDLQAYVKRIKLDRGHVDDAGTAATRLAEEVEELTEAIQEAGPPSDVSAAGRTAIAHEIADALIFLLDVANQYGIGAEEAFRAKEQVNKTRRYASTT